MSLQLSTPFFFILSSKSSRGLYFPAKPLHITLSSLFSQLVLLSTSSTSLLNSSKDGTPASCQDSNPKSAWKWRITTGQRMRTLWIWGKSNVPSANTLSHYLKLSHSMSSLLLSSHREIQILQSPKIHQKKHFFFCRLKRRLDPGAWAPKGMIVALFLKQSGWVRELNRFWIGDLGAETGSVWIRERWEWAQESENLSTTCSKGKNDRMFPKAKCSNSNHQMLIRFSDC